MNEPTAGQCHRCQTLPPGAKFGGAGDDLRLVRMRTRGKATVYDADPVLLCGHCRRVLAGHWRYDQDGADVRAPEDTLRRHREQRGGPQGGDHA